MDIKKRYLFWSSLHLLIKKLKSKNPTKNEWNVKFIKKSNVFSKDYYDIEK